MNKVIRGVLPATRWGRGRAPLLALVLLMLGAGANPTLAATSTPAPQRRGEPTVSVQLSTGVARPGEQVVMNVTVQNGRDVRITKTPAIEGLTIARPSAPITSQFREIIGGRISQRSETIYRIAIRADEAGVFEIPPLSLTVDGQELTTRAVTLKVVRDLKGDELGFLEITPSATTLVEGQPFTLELRFGWDVSTNSNYANLSLPWWDALPGALELEVPPATQNTQQVVVNDEVRVPVERIPSPPGTNRVAYRLTRSYLPTRSGALSFPNSFLEFARVSERGFFNAQRKLANYFVLADAFTLDVVPLPREGQPFDYSGAVGSFEVRAAADTRDVLVGDSIKLTVDWTGAGNLEFFEAPDLGLIDAFRGFQVYGSTEEKSFARRRVVYDLAPLTEDLDTIPGVNLSVYDPALGEYVELAADPIPIRVRPLERAIALDDGGEERFERDIIDIDARPLTTVGGSDPGAGRGVGADPTQDRLLMAGFAGLPILWLVGRALVRRRGDPDAPLERRRRRARRELSRELARSSAPERMLSAFTTFLSARTREADEAWTGRDVDLWNSASGGVSEEDARTLSDLLSRMERAAYGGGARVEKDEVLDVAGRVGRAGL